MAPAATDFNETVRLDDLAELAADGTLILRYDGDGAPLMKQPPPKQP